jgi:8-oxo-dGTP pyrophosphatase MutT (NUDIX family)
MLDDRFARIQQVLTLRGPRRVPRMAHYVETAVAVVLRPAADLEVLFIRRSEREGDPWSGHVAFPGGRRSASDPDLLATAHRETAEETGLELPSSGTVLGALDEVEPVSPRLPPVLIAPFVMAVSAEAMVTPDPREVTSAAWVPLSALRDRGSISELRLRRGGADVIFPSLVWGEYVIWGLTHRIVGQFLEVIEASGI